MQRVDRISCLVLILILAWGGSLEARERVRDAERLSSIRSTTGESVSDSSFQRRLDAILTTTPTTARSYAATQEAQKTQNALREQQVADAIASGLFVAPATKKQKLDDDLGKKQRKETEKSSTVSGRLEGRVETSEERYREDLEKRLAEEREEKEKALQEKLQETQEEIQDFEEEIESDLPPSLRNNPFYFKNNVAEQKRFDDYRRVYANRIVQALEGDLELLEAEEIVRGASTREELILLLMREEEFTYGQAEEIVRT